MCEVGVEEMWNVRRGFDVKGDGCEGDGIRKSVQSRRDFEGGTWVDHLVGLSKEFCCTSHSEREHQ